MAEAGWSGMRLRVLGAAGGWSGPGQNCSGYLLEAGGRRIWIDAGPGTFAELRRHHTLAELDALWISHVHPDHCADLLVVGTALSYDTSRQTPLPVFGPPGWVEQLTDLLVGPRVLNYFQSVELSDGAQYHIGELALQAIEMHHEPRTFGLRAQCDGKVFAYTADSGPGPALDRLAADADLLLAEAFLSVDGLPDAPGLVAIVRGPEQVAEQAAASRVSRLVLTHLHPDAEPELVRRRAESRFPVPVYLASTGAMFEL